MNWMNEYNVESRKTIQHRENAAKSLKTWKIEMSKKKDNSPRSGRNRVKDPNPKKTTAQNIKDKKLEH